MFKWLVKAVPIGGDFNVELHQTLVPPSPKHLPDFRDLTVQVFRTVHIDEELYLDYSIK